MNALVAVADVGLRALWEDILHDHGHRTLSVAADLQEWREAHTFALDIAIVELTPARPEALELCRRLRQHSQSRPSLVVLVQPADATEMLIALRTSPDDVVLGHPDRRTAVSHLASLERHRRVARPQLPTAHELASRSSAVTPLPTDQPAHGHTPAQSREPAATARVPPTFEAAPPSALPATVLLIDDEPRVRRPLAQALQHVGYRVIEAGDGEEGLELIARWGDQIAAIVADQRMPRVSGLEVLRQVRRRRRRIPVILMSGYPSLEPPGGPDGPDACLRKPFQLLDLANTVQRLLGDKVASV
jgi:CheY-like chemotaxis protein